MHRIGLLLGLPLLLSGTVLGQAQPVTLSVTGADTAPMITVTNFYPSPMTAFLVTVDLTGKNSALTRFYFDAYGNDYKFDNPIPYGSSKGIPLPYGPSLPANEVPILQAAVFADGSTWGSAEWVSEILQMRNILMVRLAETSAILRSISDRKLARAEALSLLQWERKFRAEANADAPFEQRRVHDRAFSIAMRNVARASAFNGKPAEAYNIALGLSHFFDAWHEDLRSSKPLLSGWVAQPTSSRLKARKRILQTSSYCDRPPNLRGIVRLASWPLAGPSTGRLMSAVPPQSAPSCSVSQLEVLFGTSTCGGREFHLSAAVNGSATFYGFWWAYGACAGNYTDCSDGFQPPYEIEGTVVEFQNPSPPPGTVGFGWTLQWWYAPQYHTCNCSDPNPKGSVEAPYEVDHPTPTYYLNCP